MAEMETEDTSLIVCFDTSEQNFPWKDTLPRTIEARRAQLSDALIFDLLLARGGVRGPDTLYPPRDVHSLRRLLDAIDNTNYDSLKKDCLVYYLLKWHQDARETGFAETRCIPPQFVALSDAYWYLDSGVDVPRAVSILSDARLTLNYTSKILQVISLEDRPGPQILKFVRTAQPLLTEPDDIDLYTLALAESSLLEAFQYERTFPDRSEVQSRLIKSIFAWCLSPTRPKALTHLLALPLTSHEQHLLHTFALSPPVSSLTSSTSQPPVHPAVPPMSIPILQDLVITRLIHSGQYSLAAKLDKQFAFPPPSLSLSGKAADNWRRAAQERRQTIEEVLAVMPSAERRMLEKELERAGFTADNSDPDMSWEHLRPQPTPAGASSSQAQGEPISRHLDLPPSSHLSIAQRSRGPRFGVTSTVISSGPPVHVRPAPSVSAVSSAASVEASSSFAAARQIFESISVGPTRKTVSTTVDLNGKSISASAAPAAAPLRMKSTDPVLSSKISPATGTPVPVDEIEAILEPPLVVSESISAGPTPVKAKRAGDSAKGKGLSLFDTVGSANKAPNAFFQPPTSTNGNGKRPLAALVESLSAVRQTQGPNLTDQAEEGHLADISTASALDVAAMLDAHEDSEDVNMDQDKIPAPDFVAGGPNESGEFEFSVFNPRYDRAKTRSPTPPLSGPGMGSGGAPGGIERTDSTASVYPPGAFLERGPTAHLDTPLEAVEEQEEAASEGRDQDEEGDERMQDDELDTVQRTRTRRETKTPRVTKTRSTRVKTAKVEDDEKDEGKQGRKGREKEKARPPLSRSLPGALEPLEELTELERERERERVQKQSEAHTQTRSREKEKEKEKEEEQEQEKQKPKPKIKIESISAVTEVADEVGDLPAQSPTKRRSGRKSTRGLGAAPSASSLGGGSLEDIKETTRPARRSSRLSIKGRDLVESEEDREKDSASPAKPGRRSAVASGGSGEGSGGTRTTRSRKQRS